ncbi:sigma-70 family RNA polymerase sigma factor [Methylomonas sp. SURF-2]|uniref:Sigma-70 family RNA polymerase sigma factor n=1 Tax=Methylomonas subterranea TaxID=2952225 RepID=A0ABT1TIS4_9GAMM|nr:sigma-70 family RNA polymerase sigma factor [Methylomonas sp. SURF-2]MCQ8105381.1 sigma-70 family RNA polymerase sigma factor [Methylomonas sp. SURF-2]
MLLKSAADRTPTLNEAVLAEQRPVLFRYALIKLRNAEWADDAVQETLLAAWQSATAFQGKAGLRTWLIGILKHKIADHWRRMEREVVTDVLDMGEIDMLENEDDDFFLGNGHWNGGPNTWQDPEAALKQQEFWAIYETCQNNLPAKMAQVFMLRELVGLEAEEVCRETGISDANYWVTMHRARLRLRECLEIRWFNSSQFNKESHHA